MTLVRKDQARVSWEPSDMSTEFPVPAGNNGVSAGQLMSENRPLVVLDHLGNFLNVRSQISLQFTNYFTLLTKVIRFEG